MSPCAKSRIMLRLMVYQLPTLCGLLDILRCSTEPYDTAAMESVTMLKPDTGNPVAGIKLEKNAGLIMATNNSSIVSKRSVERLYYPKPHFFQYFVRKPQRRSPTINRGYWLRMQAIESVVQEFLQRPSTRQRVIINLGCGYDPLPFQWLAREPDLCRNVRFVDVDYGELMHTKACIVRETPVLRELVMPNQEPNPHFVIESGGYYGVGCDLRDLQRLDLAIRALRDLDEALILCIAEVSLTYMDPDAADLVIAWARTLSDGESLYVTFGLLEQTLPDGPDHPFAKTMLRHFQKLNTPLRSIHKYPNSHSQSQRFYDAGWVAVNFVKLWELWSHPHFLSPSQRLRLDGVEPFDEWEEIALFAAHYFLLIARTKLEAPPMPDAARETVTSKISPETASALGATERSFSLKYVENSKPQGLRRHGALLILPDEEPGYVRAAIAHHGGTTHEVRSASSDVYKSSKFRVDTRSIPPLRIPARLCHTITRLKDGYSVLVGGRASPSAGMRDCYMQTQRGWESIEDLPSPRYRHSAAAVQLPSTVPGLLVVGGKGGADQIQHDVILWSRATGWKTLQVFQRRPQPRFGATLVSLSDDSGILSGGLRADGIVLQDLWRWKLVFRDEHAIGITFNPCSRSIDDGAGQFFGRFGATYSLVKEQLLLIGGIASSGCIPSAYEVLSMDANDLLSSNEEAELNLQVSRVDIRRDPSDPRPMLVGHATLDRADAEILILGGGAVCFSFGTCWNVGLYILYETTAPACLDWDLLDSGTSLLPTQTTLDAVNSPQPRQNFIERVSLGATAGFPQLVQQCQPRMIEGLDFGPCRRRWSKDYLLSKIGRNRPVVVHEAHSRSMNFQRKDFAYVTKAFGSFVEEVYQGAHQYLRSISFANPGKEVANLGVDYPEIAEDFRLPAELGLVAETYHSSPLRITGNVAMWLHVDTMANVLFQIEGSKRLILFPPADMVKLDFPPGSTTSSVEIFKGGDPDDILSVAGTHPIEANLLPGEVLYIPPLWAHTAAPLQGVSIAVNIFFRNLATGYAAGKDVYGNRDLLAYEHGRLHVDRISRAFRDIPRDLAHAYLLRLADELKSKADNYRPFSNPR